MKPLSKELIQVENSASATFYKLSREMLSPDSCFLREEYSWKLKLA